MPAQRVDLFDPNITDLDAPWRAEAECWKQSQDDAINALKWDTRDRKSLPFKLASGVCKNVCPVRDQCVRDAVQDPTATGVRGGFAFQNGLVLKADAAEIEARYGVEARTRSHERTQSLAKAG